MKILLTGEPRSGKTTVLKSVLELFPNRQGFVTQEIIDGGERIGFELISSSDQVAPLASINSDSELRVGKYGVQLDNLDSFIPKLAPIESGNLVYIDEIGQMQLFSDSFKNLVDGYLNTDNPFIGTISSVYQDDFIEKVLSRDDIILLNITESNRDSMVDIIRGRLLGC